MKREEEILRKLEYKNIFNEGLTPKLEERVNIFMVNSSKNLQKMKKQYNDNVISMKINKDARKMIAEVSIQDSHLTVQAISYFIWAENILKNKNFNDCIKEMENINKKNYDLLMNKVN